jgi:RNA polymerase sigma-70 factor (ECF subfamily)
VAALVRRVGVQHVELVEDAVQSAFMAALTAWTDQSAPADPSAWLYTVACNRLLQDLRQQSRQLEILEHAAADLSERAGGT